MLRWSTILGLYLAVVPVALAQPTGDDAAGHPAPQPEAAQPVAAPSYLPAMAPMPQQTPTITGPQMLAQGRQYRKDINAIRTHIQGQADSAKEDKDVIRLNCLLDKLTQLGAREKSMDQSLQSLEEAVMRQATSDQLHEYTRITIIHQKVEELRTEADACIGAETSYVGPTRVVVEAPPDLAQGVDQPPPAAPPFTAVDRPVPASPFR